MYQVVKRNGKIAEFDLSKISTAVTKAFEACDKPYTDEESGLVFTAKLSRTLTVAPADGEATA